MLEPNALGGGYGRERADLVDDKVLDVART